ncbi:MAG: GntR family transcriptional regulator [Pseudomonadota bacterium]
MTDSVAAAATTTLADRILTDLTTAIVEGDLAPGEKLREPDLARRFGTSRGPLRDALRRLESRRLVLTTPNAGARVVSLSAEQLIALYELREALEGQTARLAAERISEQELGELERLLDTHEQEIERRHGREYFRQQGDLDFHFRIARASANALLYDTLCVDHYQLMRLYRTKFSNRVGRPHRALTEHRRILDALRDRDGELAEFLMRRHIRTARSAIAETSAVSSNKETTS